MVASARPTCAAKPASARPSASSVFHTGWRAGSRYSMANTPSCCASTRGTACGSASPATRNHPYSYRLRSTGASHSCATRRRGRARFTQTGPRARSTRQMSDDTPPESAVAGGVSFMPIRPLSLRNRKTGSGSESLKGPGLALPAIKGPVGQPVRAALPELDRLRDEPVAAPVRRARRMVAELALLFREQFLQNRAIGHPFALRRGPGREARAQRTGREVGVRFLGADFLDHALDPHLALQIRPEEHRAGGGAGLELASFAAEVVGIEDETAALDALEQDHARRGRAVGAYRGERHFVGQRQLRAQRVLEPALELADGVRVGLRFRQPRAHVFLPKIRHVHARDFRAVGWRNANFRGKVTHFASANR